MDSDESEDNISEKEEVVTKRRRAVKQKPIASKRKTRSANKKPIVVRKPFVCKWKSCDKSFNEKHRLIRHIKSCHSTERPHKCKVCTKSFARSDHLLTHVKTHNSYDILKCKYCPFETLSDKTLGDHLSRHENIRRFKCTETGCDKVFVTNSDLSQHKLYKHPTLEADKSVEESIQTVLSQAIDKIAANESQQNEELVTDNNNTGNEEIESNSNDSEYMDAMSGGGDEDMSESDNDTNIVTTS